MMIELQNIYKHYGSLCVLDDINLTVSEGEIMVVAGPSGAGKTTLVQVAGTLDSPDSGRVLYDGEDLTRMSDRRLSAFRNANIGFIFQFHQLLPEFSALENVMLPARIAGTPGRRSRERAMELLELMGLSERAQHKPAQLSGGERQRVAIARALVNSPRLVFADEPTGSLDTARRDEILEIIVRLNRELNQTFVIVTHDTQLYGVAHRLVMMRDGRIISVTGREEVLS